VQARGLARPEPLPTSLEQMAADYADQIRQVQPAGPYFLLGWSFGGLVAHAVATELHQRGEQTALLAMLDAYPMCDLSEEPPAFDERDVLISLLDGDPQSLEDEPMTFAQFVDILRNRGSALASLEEHHIAAVIEIMSNNIRLACDFTPGHFPGDLLLFTSTPDPGHDAPTPEVWRRYIDGTIKSHDITSRHHLMTQPEALAQIGPILAAKLHDIASGTSPSHRRS
ncbi:MAG: alpha/beta fold hydrolase, partial [Pseudonocardiaceae bacterium]